jgi:2-methylisocitrate lyase-like PEP mutase family enzyme
MSRARQFRDMLGRGGLTIAPGAYDCITARSIVQAGFERGRRHL